MKISKDMIRTIITLLYKELDNREQINLLFDLESPYVLAEAALEVLADDVRPSLWRDRYCVLCGKVEHHGGFCDCKVQVDG